MKVFGLSTEINPSPNDTLEIECIRSEYYILYAYPRTEYFITPIWNQIIAQKVIFRVIPCDIRKVPLEDTTVDVAIFCLSLMATDASQFILEANRILRLGGKLLIAEVSSRIENTKKFVKTLGSYGFTLERDDTSNSHFVLFFLKKFRDSNDIKNRPPLTFRPCQYKKR